MDPTTTLFTFMLQTRPSVRVVQLIGSWDNFTRGYTMERDSRRDRGQWRGCYTFKDITCEGDAGSIPKRDGGLKMGHTYYYYYELDGASETHDPSQPSTTTCPYLPGQTVNTLWIPVEQSLRKRSASLTSLRDEDFKTMDPASKFVSPRPAPTPPEPARRLGTAPLRMQPQKRPARSPSPSSRWSFSPRKLFSRKSSSSSLGDMQTPQAEDARSLRSEGSRSRDISPESLRRFLVDDAPLAEHEHDDTTSTITARPTIAIPEDIVEENENEDDDNFATSAISETMQFTGLSPPPPRSVSPTARTQLPAVSRYMAVPSAPTRPPPRLPTLKIAPAPSPSINLPVKDNRSHFSAQSPDSNSLPEFDLSDDDDEDDDDEHDEENIPGQNPFARNLAATLSTYSLPRTAGTDGGVKMMVTSGTPHRQQRQQRQAQHGQEEQSQEQAAALSAVAGEGVPSLMLSSPIPDAGLGELVSELGWMAGMIRGEYH